jgi:hypothetical protein
VTKEPWTITIDRDNELGRTLVEAGDEPLVLMRGTSRFRIMRDPDDPWAHDEPAKLITGLQKVAGMPSPEEGDRIIERNYRGRENGTRPIARP